MNLGPFPQKFQMSYLSTRTDTNDNLMYLSYGTKTIFLVSRVPGFPDFVQTADQKFVREAFLDCIDTFARTGRPAAATGWPAFSTSPDQVPGTVPTVPNIKGDNFRFVQEVLMPVYYHVWIKTS